MTISEKALKLIRVAIDYGTGSTMLDNLIKLVLLYFMNFYFF